MKPPVDAEARGMLTTDNEVRAAGVCLTSFGKSVFPDQVRAALEAAAQVRVACPNTYAVDRDRLATALAASQARAEELGRQVADHNADRAAVDDALLNMDFGEWEGDLRSVAAIVASDMRRVVSDTRRRAERRRRQARALPPSTGGHHG